MGQEFRRRFFELAPEPGGRDQHAWQAVGSRGQREAKETHSRHGRGQNLQLDHDRPHEQCRQHWRGLRPILASLARVLEPASGAAEAENDGSDQEVEEVAQPGAACQHEPDPLLAAEAKDAFELVQERDEGSDDKAHGLSESDAR